jgi:lysophospholipase L1-like esterase
MIFIPMQARRRPLNLAWGFSRGRSLCAFGAGLVLGLCIAGCGSIPQANSNIAFMGDSITAFWWLPRTNLGIPGNTTAQMLARFPEQVPGHSYRAVLILGGTNDIRTGVLSTPQTVAKVIGNLEQMAQLAEQGNAEVVLCAIPPIRGETARVLELNAAIQSLASEHSYKYVDFYTPMADHPEYFRDGLHPNVQGYFVMQAALTRVLPLDY